MYFDNSIQCYVIICVLRSKRNSIEETTTELPHRNEAATTTTNGCAARRNSLVGLNNIINNLNTVYSLNSNTANNANTVNNNNVQNRLMSVPNYFPKLSLDPDSGANNDDVFNSNNNNDLSPSSSSRKITLDQAKRLLALASIRPSKTFHKSMTDEEIEVNFN